MLARPMALLFLTVIIAHRWPMGEIAKFESFGLFQYFIFFSWLPAWGLSFIRMGSKRNSEDQKSFLFSVFISGFVLSLALCFVLLIFMTGLLPWESKDWQLTGKAFTILLSYFISSASIYRFYLQKKMASQWLYGGIQFLGIIFFAWICSDFKAFIQQYFWFTCAFIMYEFTQQKWSRTFFNFDFWKEVAVYSLYFAMGSFITIICAYAVQRNFGLGNELSVYRYGTREIPLIPVLLSAFGLSFLKSSAEDILPVLSQMKTGMAKLILLMVPVLLIIVIFGKEIFEFLYGNNFDQSAYLMATFSLIYLFRFIPSNMVLQLLNDKKRILMISILELIFILAGIVFLNESLNLIQIVWLIIIGTCLERMLQVFILWKKYKIPIQQYLPVRLFLICSFIMLIFYSIVWTGAH